MKNTNTPTIEQGIENALTMYAVNVSPSEDRLHKILSQIPEQKTHKERRAVRSPYIWLAITQVVTLCSIMIAVLPTITDPSHLSNPYYSIDRDIETFETSIDAQDAETALVDYNL
jgi:hypothetical protein